MTSEFDRFIAGLELLRRWAARYGRAFRLDGDHDMMIFHVSGAEPTIADQRDLVLPPGWEFGGWCAGAWTFTFSGEWVRESAL